MIHKNLSVGVDIGGTHIICGAVNLSDARLEEATVSRKSFHHEAGAGVILQSWANALNETFSKINTDRLAGIGFAIPGPFEYQNGISRMKHKFAPLYGVHIPGMLGKLLRVKGEVPMRFINDATAFAAGEAWTGEGRGYQKVVVITLGTGFGSAFLDNGIPVVKRAGVPEEGCLWHLPFKDGIADAYFSTGWFVREFEKHHGEKIEGVKDIIEKAGIDSFVDALFARFGRNLAECLAPWLQSFGAEILLIGGNIAHTLPLFEADFRKGLEHAGVSLKIAPSRLMEHAALIGSARLLDDAFWGKVSAELPGI